MSYEKCDNCDKYATHALVLEDMLLDLCEECYENHPRRDEEEQGILITRERVEKRIKRMNTLQKEIRQIISQEEAKHIWSENDETLIQNIKNNEELKQYIIKKKPNNYELKWALKNIEMK